MPSYDRVLLTGSNGLVGRALASLLAQDCNLRRSDVTEPADAVGDLLDPDFVLEACRGMDGVVHTAALHGKTWAEAGDDVGFAVNVIGTRNVLEAARKADVRRVVFTSSIWATGHGTGAPYLPIDEDLPRRPAELYGLTKQLGEEICAYYTENHGFSTLCLRPGSILPADAPPQARRSLLTGSVDVRDVAQAHVLALRAPESILHERFVITAHSPLCDLETDEVWRDPVAALEQAVPGVASLLEEGSLELPPLREWYTIERARRLLRYEPAHNFNLNDYR